MFSTFISFLLIVAAFAGGLYLAKKWYAQPAIPEKTENTTLLLERIRNVCKLVTVEGYISEIYDYKHYKWYNVPLLSKKALIRIKAKVLVGYDLSKMNIHMNPETKTVFITQFPQPSVISIEDDMDYYDINNGIFNTFMPEDYNELNQRAKDFIRQQAETSGLLESAAVQGNKMLEIVQVMTESLGWKVSYMELSPKPEIKLLNETNPKDKT